MNIVLPYGKETLACSVPDERVIGVLCGKGMREEPSRAADQIVAAAMAAPYGSPRLREMAKGRKNIVILASDHTRPVPSRVIMPLMLREIREGNPDAHITILIATGCHRASTREELAAKFGEDIVDREQIVVHDCDSGDLADLGTLPSGGALQINGLAARADLLVSEGFIEPHFFAGFSGGRKNVLPGIASRACVRYNHNSRFMDDPHARAGELEGNPIHRDMVYAAQRAGLAYIVNVVLNSRGQVIAAFAGDFQAAHQAGAAYVSQKMNCPAGKADIVITTNNGYPLDQNLYQMVKGMDTAQFCCREGGTIIAVGKCSDGIGGEEFRRIFSRGMTPTEILTEFRRTPAEDTRIDQWQAHILARILEKHRVILVSDLANEVVSAFQMTPAATVEEAITLAGEGGIYVIPEGISVIIRENG